MVYIQIPDGIYARSITNFLMISLQEGMGSPLYQPKICSFPQPTKITPTPQPSKVNSYYLNDADPLIMVF